MATLTFILKRRPSLLSQTQAIVFFLFLVVCFVKQCVAETSASTYTQPVSTSTSDTASTAITDNTSSAPTITTKVPLDGNCSTSDNCLSGNCFFYSCKCNNTQYNNSGSCENKISLGSSCNITSQCENTTECIGNGDLKVCGCNETHFSNDNATCQQKPKHKESCNPSITKICLDQLMECTKIQNGTFFCLCNNTFWFNNTCQSKSQLNVQNVTTVSTDKSVTISWNPVPYGTVSYIITDEKNKKNETTNQTTATFGELSPGKNYTFIITTIYLNDNFYQNISHSQNTTVTTKFGHGDNCTAETQCVLGTLCIKDRININRCLCNTTTQYLSTDGNCSIIKSVSPMVEKRETTSILFKWNSTNNNHNQTINYFISVNNKEIQANDSGCLVSGLTPGNIYQIFFITRVLEDSYYFVRNVTTNYTSYWTKPAQPGEIKPSTYADSKAKFTIVPSEGNVSKYEVNITISENETETQTTTNTSVVFYKLQPAKKYSYTIVSINEIGDVSDSKKGEVATPSISSEAVTMLNVENITADSAMVTWMKPLNANGNMTGYLAYVMTDKCVAAYQINCNDCISSLENITLEVCESNYNLSQTSQDLENCSYIIKISLQKLKPYKNYSVKVIPVNVAGTGEPSAKNFSTKEGSPYPVTNVVLSPTQNSSKVVGLNLTWTSGEFTGPTNYTIHLCEKKNLSDNTYIMEKNVTGFNNTFTTFDDLLGFWNYSVTITAKTVVGQSEKVESSTVQTYSKEPGLAKFNLSQDDLVANKVQISISCPDERDRHGNIMGFTIKKTFLSSENNVSTCQNSTMNNSCSQVQYFDLLNMTVESNYSIQVSVFNQHYRGPYSDGQLLHVKSKKPLAETVRNSVIPTNIASETEITVEVWPSYLKNESQGKVIKCGLLVCIETESSECFSQIKKKRSVSDIGGYDITWSKAKENNFKTEYRTTPDNWLKDRNDHFQYSIGNNQSCKNGYCNGPLPADRKIKVRVIVCTDDGCLLILVDVFATKASEDPVPKIVGGVVGGILGLALIAAVVGVFIWYKRRPKRSHPSSPFWDMDSESRKREHIKEQRPIKIFEFKDHVIRLHKDSNLLFQDEFEDIKKLSARFTHTSEKAKEESNRVKNRYVDILPYDHSRVKLDIQPEDDDTMDFINANFIPGYNSVREYIATQGPMHYTIPDFWRMTWEQKSKVIVMLSDLQEQGKRKVDLYWPENLNEPINYGNIIVEMTNFSQLNKYIIRNFKISRGSETRKVTHFFLPGWWDFSANLTTDDVLEFAKLVRQEATPANTGPIIVHCSAGVGRTGTFIALDYFMQYIDKHSLMESIDIFSYVMKMRYNRPRMVQAETQYIFIFDALEEIISKKIKDEEEKMAEHTYGNGNIYANVTVKQPEESIYANSEPVKDKNAYDNQAFEMDYQNMDLNQSKKDNPTTVL